MTKRKTAQSLVILSALVSAGFMAAAPLASAADEFTAPSRMEMMIKKLMPDGTEADTENSSNLVSRLVSSHNGIGQQNVLINENHSLDLSVLFAPGSDALTGKARALLRDLARALNADPLSNATYLIGGHTDATGDPEENRKLSEQRARSVKAFLVNTFNIDPDRLATAGYGDERLVDTDNPDAQINRRIEVSLISTGYSVPKKRRAQFASARSQTTSSSAAYNPRSYDRAAYAPRRVQRVAYRVNREFDDYNSDIFTPPTVNGYFATGYTGNVVCDSFEGVLTDPRPAHMHMDDYDARTPTTCKAINEFQGRHTSYKDRRFGKFSDEDDNELLK